MAMADVAKDSLSTLLPEATPSLSNPPRLAGPCFLHGKIVGVNASHSINHQHDVQLDQGWQSPKLATANV
jgi:hypothetical protein